MTIKNLDNFFLILIVFLPISFLIGPGISLANIILFDLCFVIFIITTKKFEWIKTPIIKILLILYFYLIFNSLISLDYDLNLLRNFGFIRLIILFAGINYFMKNKNFSKIFYLWSILILIIVFDIFFERIYGSNLLGYSSYNQRRIVSFFKDELIVGGFVYAFAFIIIGYYFEKFKNYSLPKKNLLFLGIFIIFLSVLATGERSNSIRFILSLFIFLSFVNFLTLKTKIFSLILIAIISISVVINSEYLKGRMFESIKYSASTFVKSYQHGQPMDNPGGNIYAKLYRSGYEVFKANPHFGVGNKNYRLESCDNNSKKNYLCMTHPHQIYFELLSEHGLIGTLIILSLFFLIFFESLKRIILEKNYVSCGCLSYLFIIFTPILPSGAFFSDYNITLLFINLSIMYGCSKKLNIFNYSK